MGSRLVAHKTYCFALVIAYPVPSLFVAFDSCDTLVRREAGNKPSASESGPASVRPGVSSSSR
jgi:hypothetical protein